MATLRKADRRHTIPVFIAALETGARWSSLVEFLKCKHVNFKAEEVTITTYKDKNMKQWKISVSTRFKSELLKFKLQRNSDDPDKRLFATRMAEAGMEIARWKRPLALGQVSR